MKKKKWIWFVNVLLLAALAAVVFYAKDYEQHNAQLYQGSARAYEDEINPLFEQRADIERKLNGLDSDLAEMNRNLGLGSVIVLVSEPDARVLTDIQPAMADYDFVGMIALSDERFPGEEGCMTVEDLFALCRDGWQLCLTAGDGSDLTELNSRRSALGLPAPAAVYFPQSNYGPTFQHDVSATGVGAVIQRRAAPEEENGIWFISSVGSTESDSATLLSDSVVNSDCLVLSVGFHNNYEMYTERNFTAMLSTIQQHINDNELALAPVSVARTRYLSFQDAKAKNAAEIEAQRQDLTLQMAAVWDAIESVNQKYAVMREE